MRQPDINRVNRAMEHIMAAITCINSIKWEHRSPDEEAVLESTKGHLADEYRVLKVLAEKKGDEE